MVDSPPKLDSHLSVRDTTFREKARTLTQPGLSRLPKLRARVVLSSTHEAQLDSADVERD